MNSTTTTQEAAQPDGRADPAASDAAAAAIAAQLKNLDKRHVGAAMSKLISASIGDICVVMSKSPAYKFHTLADIEWLVLPAVLSGQFYVGAYASVERGHTAPAAVITWERVSDEIDRRLAKSSETSKRLKPEDWTSGENTWLIDVVGDSGVVAVALQSLTKADLAGKPVKLIQRTGDGNHATVLLSAMLTDLRRLAEQGT